MEHASMETRLEELMGHESWLRRFATSLVHSEAVADDLVQETWLAAIHRPPPSDRPARPWLARVVRNIVRMRHRSDSRRRRREAAAGPRGSAAMPDDATAAPGTSEPATTADSPTADELLERVQTQRMLADVVVELEEPYRTVILLHYFEGLSAADIARRQGVPASTVRARHKMGLDKLRRALDQRNGGNRKAWCLALQPFVIYEPATASTGVWTGVLAMKTTYKLALVSIALIAVFLGVSALRGSRGDSSPDSERNPTIKKQPAPRLSQRTAAIMPDEHATAEADPVGDLRLEGQVIDAESRPVADALITVSTNPLRKVRSEADGSFFFDGLLPRRYSLVATAGGERAGPIGARLTAESDPVILQLEAGAALQFDIVGESSQQPVVGASVQLRGWVMRAAESDDSGRVTFAGLPFGRYNIAVSAPGYGKTHTIAIATEGTQTERIALRVGAPVAGRVVDEQGAPVAGANVVYMSMANSLHTGTWAHDALESDEQGQFRLPPLARGTYRFSARKSGFATGFSDPVTLDGVTSVTDVQIRLSPEGQIAGQVLSTGGLPVASATVVVAVAESQWHNTRQVITDVDGRFSLGGLPRGKLLAMAHNERASSDHQKIDLRREGKQGDLTLTLQHEDFIAGRVIDPQGQALDGIEVRAYPVRSLGGHKRTDSLAWMLRRSYQELTDASGAFQLTGLPPGEYELRANPPQMSARGLDWLRQGTKAKSGDTDVLIELEPAGSLHGKVAFADGSVPEMYTVSLWESRLDIRPFRNADGEFAIDALPPGEYTVRVNGPGFEQKRVSGVLVEPGESSDLGTVEVQRGRVISGRVLDADGAPVPGAEVTAGHLLIGSGLDADMGRFGPSFASGTRSTMTDEEGRFALYSVAQGRISMIAAHSRSGRSTPMEIPIGSQVTQGVELVLAGYGALEGTVMKNGEPVGHVQVVARSRRSPSTLLMVAASDGKFRFDRLAPDEYSVQAMPGGPLSGFRFHTAQASVEVGATARVTLEVTTGPGRVAARPTTAEGRLANAMIFHAQGPLAGATAWELLDTTGRSVGGNWSLAFSSQSSPAYISGLQVGEHTVCAVAFPDQVQGMNAMFEVVLSHSEALTSSCQPVTVREGVEEETVEIPVTVPSLPDTP